MNTNIAVMAAKIDLHGAWKTFEQALGNTVNPLLTLLAVFGVLIVIVAIGKWAWDRRRGQGGMGQTGGVWGGLLVGALMCAPKVLIPIFLLILDVIANAVIRVWENTAANEIG